MTKQVKRLYEFGPFQLDTTERMLRRNGQEIVLDLKPYELLLVLIENSGRIVDKEVIMQMVWPKSFVSEGNIYENISILRRTLSEGGDNQRYIETIPKRGYRFTAPVREIVEEDEAHNRGQWLIVISATIKDIDKPLAEAIEAHLRKLSKDVTLTLMRIKEGSVILIFEGTHAGFERISELVESGQLSEIFGFDIENLQWEQNSESIHVEPPDTVRTYPDDLSHRTEGALALDKGLAPFDKLLLAFGVDREQAAIRYMKIREILIKFFKYKGAEYPEELADNTFDRVAQKIEEIKRIPTLSLEHYFLAVARNILREYSRKRYSNELMPGLQMLAAEGDETDKRRREYFETCIQRLPDSDRELILAYYTDEDRIKSRKNLADLHGISLAALRHRIARIRRKLEKYVSDCMEQESIDI